MSGHRRALLGATVFLTLASAPTLADSEACAATYRRLPEVQEQRVTEWADMSFKVALIGCREQLESLTVDEITELMDEILRQTLELSTVLAGVIDERETRLPIVRKINERLGKDVLSDIFFYAISVTEHRRR